ncbi:hypothetical protein GOBAR_AA09406 [Gossypium barbadense]|uniref:Uncharacterized protein n=1 Tax=Gossypium barbadense TaxID=3634 RepID=A0A2P5Y6N1_GOSBA|nr:hypothetical protein GOBAR_AA09406 [Gossypium barbadense]
MKPLYELVCDSTVAEKVGGPNPRQCSIIFMWSILEMPCGDIWPISVSDEDWADVRGMKYGRSKTCPCLMLYKKYASADALEQLGSWMPVAGMRATQHEEGWRILVVTLEDVAPEPFCFFEAGMELEVQKRKPIVVVGGGRDGLWLLNGGSLVEGMGGCVSEGGEGVVGCGGEQRGRKGKEETKKGERGVGVSVTGGLSENGGQGRKDE